MLAENGEAVPGAPEPICKIFYFKKLKIKAKWLPPKTPDNRENNVGSLIITCVKEFITLGSVGLANEEVKLFQQKR